jgi:hypothetical protein
MLVLISKGRIDMKAIMHSSVGDFLSVNGIFRKGDFDPQRRSSGDIRQIILGAVVGLLLCFGLLHAIISNDNLPEVHVSASTGKVVKVLDGKTHQPVMDLVVRAKLLEGRWKGGGPIYVP